ncbi:MAG: PstS family phosphate ABC transporter substrate-binding protein [candidate division WOR-3 bacterium]
MRRRIGTGMMAALIAAGCGGGQKGPEAIRIKGSDSEVNLVQSLAEAYMAKDKNAVISVQGGGSGVGIAAIINKEVEIANSSREMKPDEIERARANGVEPLGFIFAIDAIAIIVHPDNPINEISLENLGKLYRGDIKNWKEMGGPDAEVSLYGRQSNSGTFVFFRDAVLKGDYSPNMKAMNGNSQIVDGVKTDKAGIGYVALGYVRQGGSFTPGVKVIRVDGKLPGEGGYALARPLYQYLQGKPKGKVRDFLAFELSDEGQTIIEKGGFLRVTGTEYEKVSQEILE